MYTWREIYYEEWMHEESHICCLQAGGSENPVSGVLYSEFKGVNQGIQ